MLEYYFYEMSSFYKVSLLCFAQCSGKKVNYETFYKTMMKIMSLLGRYGNTY